MCVCVGGGGVCINFMDRLTVYKAMYRIEHTKNSFSIECSSQQLNNLFFRKVVIYILVHVAVFLNH